MALCVWLDREGIDLENMSEHFHSHMCIFTQTGKMQKHNKETESTNRRAAKSRKSYVWSAYKDGLYAMVAALVNKMCLSKITTWQACGFAISSFLDTDEFL